MPTSAVLNFSGRKVEPLKPETAKVDNVNLAASTTYPAGTILGEKIGRKEVQRITITGTPTGGSFTITYAGQTTTDIAFNATAADVRNALEALSNIPAGGVVVSGGPGPGTAFTIQFTARGDIAAVTTTDSFSGGSGPASAVTTVTAGTAGTPGTYGAYDQDNTDGSEIPTHVLMYDVVTDASGNVFMGDSAASEWNNSSKYAQAYRAGYFATEDLVGFDENARSLMNARLTHGDLVSGRVLIPG